MGDQERMAARLTLAQAAKALGLSTRTLRRRVGEGKLCRVAARQDAGHGGRRFQGGPAESGSLGTAPRVGRRRAREAQTADSTKAEERDELHGLHRIPPSVVVGEEKYLSRPCAEVPAWQVRPDAMEKLTRARRSAPVFPSLFSISGER